MSGATEHQLRREAEAAKSLVAALADHDETGFVPNEEMKLLTVVRAALAKAGVKI